MERNMTQKHNGFAVVGYSPEQIAEAKEKHEKHNPGTAIPFDPHQHVRGRQKVAGKLSIPAAAQDLKTYLEKRGWIKVDVKERISGDA